MLRTLLVAALLGPAHPPSEFDLGSAAFAEGDYEAAAEHYEAAYANGDAADVLYEWAQSVRRGGDCAGAAELYDRFLLETGETTPDPDLRAPELWAQMRANAAQQRDKCREDAVPPAVVPTPAITAGAEDDAGATEGDSTPPAGDDVAAEPIPASPEGGTGDEPPPPVETPPDRAKRRPDALGVTLVTVGAVTASVGAGLLIAAPLVRRAAEDEFVHDDHNRRIDSAIAQQRAGFVLAPVGVALVVGGAIRLAVVARRRRPDRRASAWISPTMGGAVVHGRF